YEKEGYDVLLAAPTGRAAKRMSEATGYEAATIHRMLEVSGGLDDERRGKFSRNDENPLETDVVIVDEMSMVDITLFYALLKAMVAGMRLILVGDQNQLPSVGPGNVLKDIIQSGAVPVVTLKKIFRQEDTGDIVVNAHKINRGEEVDPNNNSKDFFLMKRYDADVITAVSMKLINENLPKYVEAGPLDIQVLTPSRKGLLGVENLNTVIQEKLNPPATGKPELKYGERIFRVGDKVMQNRNDYNAQWEILGKYNIPVETGNGVFNGDMGIVTDVDTVSKTVTVVFDENRTVKYQTGSLDDIELSYAITIHKAQGSEYPAVVIPLLPGPKMLYTRNLLYTAVTRAKKCVVIVGDDNTFRAMIRNNTETERYSGLKERIMECQNMESSTGQ
nr:AAA family ATPase [Lachnospiraceae bacterium]